MEETANISGVMVIVSVGCISASYIWYRVVKFKKDVKDWFE
jgi:hypothetical protein